MPEQEFKPFTAEEMLSKELKQSEPQVSLNPAVTSGLDVEPTIKWYNKSQQFSAEWNVADNLWNGTLQQITNKLGFFEALSREGDEARVAKGTDTAESRAGTQELVETRNKIEDLQNPVDMSNKTFTAKAAGMFAQNIPQLVAQMVAYRAGGPIASTALMIADIVGSKYVDLFRSGVSHEKALKAAVADAVVQTPLEQISLMKWVKLTRTGSALNYAKQLLGAGATEFTTEFLQEVPEQVADIWGRLPDASVKDVANLWWQRRNQYFENMLLAGTVGFMSGVAGGSVNSYINEKAKLDYQKDRVDALGEIVKSDIESGANPEYVATASDTISVLAGNDDTAYIDAEPLNAFFQTVSEEEATNMATLMGTTVEDVRTAAAEGTEVETTMGGVRGASVASHGALYEAIKNNLTFDLESRSISTGEAFQKLMKNAYALEAKQSQELYDTVDTLAKQMHEAGMSKEMSNYWRTLLISRALTARADNPVQLFKDNPLRVVKGEDGRVGIEFGQNVIKGTQVKKKLDALKKKDFNEFNDVIKRSNGDLLKYHNEKWENDSASSRRVKAALEEIAAHPVLSKLATLETLQHYFNGEYIATPETLLFTLYTDASVDGRNQFDLVEWANNKGIGDVKTAEAMLNGLSFNHPEWINYSGTHDLHNISLRDDMMKGSTVAEFNQNVGLVAYSADLFELDRAMDMEKEGKSKEEIFKETGWFRGAEGKWRMYIPDDLNAIDSKVLTEEYNKYKNKDKYVNEYDGKVYRLGDIYKNDRLFAAYPELAEVGVTFYSNPSKSMQGYMSFFNIYINAGFSGLNDKNYDEIIKLTLVHEIQHVIQHIEGFAKGGVPSSEGARLDVTSKQIRTTGEIWALGKEIKELFNYEQEFNGGDIAADTKYQELLAKAKASVDEETFAKYEKLKKQLESDEFDAFVASKMNDYEIYRNLAGEVEARQTEANAEAGEMLPGNLRLYGFVVGARDSFNQQSDRILGKYQPIEQEGTGIIRMFDGADASTVIHETGHYFLDAMAMDVARGIADEKTAADLEKLLNYAGTNTQDFLLMSVGQSTEYHEKIAEAFETYLMEGKPPSRELRSVFKRFKDWLLAIYKERKRNDYAIPLTDEVRQVFDSMLACDEALHEIEVTNGYLSAMEKDGLWDKIEQLDENSKNKLRDMLLKVHDRAVEILAKRANENFSEERKAQIAKYKEEVLPVVAEEIRTMPLYQAISMLRQYTNIALEGKGDKANVRAIARRYLNQEGRAFSNWQEELKAVNAELDDMILPVVEDLKSGMGHGVTIVEVPEEVQGGSTYYRYSNNEEWYQNWWAEYGRRPSAYDLRELAIQNLEGKAGRFTTRSMYGLPDDIATENETRIKELLARKDMLEEQQDKVSLGRKKGLSIEDMTTFEMLAESNGFANGEELANAILNMPTEKQAVDLRMDELVRNAFPNFWEEKKSALEAAQEALYNDPNADLIALEEQLMYEALDTTLEKQLKHDERLRIARAEAFATKAEANARILDMTLRKARLPRQFINDERKAAVNAALAMAKGDVENALKYKHQQLVAHQMVGMSMAVREKYDISLRALKRMSKRRGFPKNGEPSYWYDEGTFLAAAELMTRMGLKVRDYDVATHFNNDDLQNYVNVLREQGWPIFIPDGVLNGTLDVSKPGTLTVDEYFSTVKALKNFRAVANAIHGVNEELKAQKWADVKDRVRGALEKLETVWTPEAGERNKASTLEMAQAAWRSTDNLWEMMDGWTYGYFNTTWGAMFKHCADREAVMINKWDEQTKEITQSWAKAMKERGIDVDKKVAYADLGLDANGNPVTLTRHNLIAMLCYLGSQSGMERLCGTRLVGIDKTSIWVAPADNTKLAKQQAIDETRINIKKFLENHVTKADMEYAQNIIDACEQWWPELEEVNRRTIGFAPDKVLPMGIALQTIDGEIVSIKGGYVPLVRNGDGGSHPFNQDRVWNLDTNEKFNGKSINTMNTTTAASSNRTNASYPVDISQGWFDIPIRDTVHDICYREAMQEFKKLFNDDEIYGLLKEKLGIATTAQFREMLIATAQPYGGPSMNLAEVVFANALNAMRRMTVHAAILGNLKTAAQNISNLYLFGNAVEGFSYADVTAAIFGNFGLRAFRPGGLKELDALCSKSVFFKERSKFLDFSMRDIVQKSKLSKIETETMRWGTAVLVMTDNLTAKPIWAMAYTKKINQGATEQEAIDFADTIIRRTLGSSRIQDVSSAQRGGPFLRAFTTFQSFFNVQYNQWAREYNIAGKMVSKEQYKEAAFRVTSFLAAKYLLVCLVSTVAALKNPFGNDDDDDDKPNNLQKELMLYPMSMLGPIGQASNVFIQKLAGIRSYGYKMTAAQSAVDKFTNLATPIKKAMNGDLDSWQELVEPTVGAVTFYYGIPDQMNKLFWNAWDIMVNDMDPEWGDLMRRRPKRDR